MLDLAALHIMELAFSKHLDNERNSPSSESTEMNLWRRSQPRWGWTRFKCFYELRARVTCSLCSDAKMLFQVFPFGRPLSFKEAPPPPLGVQMNGVAEFVRKVVKLSQESPLGETCQAKPTPDTLPLTVGGQAALPTQTRKQEKCFLHSFLFRFCNTSLFCASIVKLRRYP